MKRIILLAVITCLAMSMASAQNARGAVRNTQTQERYGNSPAQQDIKADRQFKRHQKATFSYYEVEQAKYAMDEAQRKLNELSSKRQEKIDKFNKKLEKITDPIKRAAEQKKFEEKLEKEMLKAQNNYENAQMRYYNALDNFDRAKAENR